MVFEFQIRRSMTFCRALSLLREVYVPPGRSLVRSCIFSCLAMAEPQVNSKHSIWGVHPLKGKAVSLRTHESLNICLWSGQGYNSHGELGEIWPLVVWMRVAPSGMQRLIPKKWKSRGFDCDLDWIANRLHDLHSHLSQAISWSPSTSPLVSSNPTSLYSLLCSLWIPFEFPLRSPPHVLSDRFRYVSVLHFHYSLCWTYYIIRDFEEIQKIPTERWEWKSWSRLHP
jgi:hypothetical protein